MNPRTLFAGLFAVSLSTIAVAADGEIKAPPACTDFSGRYSSVGCEGTLRSRAPFELAQLGCSALILIDQGNALPTIFHLDATDEQTIRFEPNTHTESASVKMKRESHWLDGRVRLQLKIDASESVTPRGERGVFSTTETTLTLSRLADGTLRVDGKAIARDRDGTWTGEQGTCTYSRR